MKPALPEGTEPWPVMPDKGRAQNQGVAMASHRSTNGRKYPEDHEGNPITVEFSFPGDWSPGLALAVAQEMEKAIKVGFPIVVPVRKGATPEQVSCIVEDVRTLVERAGLTAR